ARSELERIERVAAMYRDTNDAGVSPVRGRVPRIRQLRNPRRAGPVESPTRCPYDNEGRCASVVASRPDSGPSTPIEVAPRLRGRLPDQRALQPYGPWRGMITRGAVLTSASGAPTIGVVDDAVPGRD